MQAEIPIKNCEEGKQMNEIKKVDMLATNKNISTKKEITKLISIHSISHSFSKVNRKG